MGSSHHFNPRQRYETLMNTRRAPAANRTSRLPGVPRLGFVDPAGFRDVPILLRKFDPVGKQKSTSFAGPKGETCVY
jgi:hypothetical protein